MRLTGKVVAVHSGAKEEDKVPRVDIQVEQGELMHKQFRVPNIDRLTIDDVVTIEVTLNNDATHTMPLAASGVTRG